MDVDVDVDVDASAGLLLKEQGVSSIRFEEAKALCSFLMQEEHKSKVKREKVVKDVFFFFLLSV